MVLAEVTLGGVITSEKGECSINHAKVNADQRLPRQGTVGSESTQVY